MASVCFMLIHFYVVCRLQMAILRGLLERQKVKCSFSYLTLALGAGSGACLNTNSELHLMKIWGKKCEKETDHSVRL